MRKNEINVITLGCSKNLVDSEALIKKFAISGYKVRHDPERVTGEIVVINTCGFIGDAQEESVNTILRFVRMKQEGRIRKLFVMGCLSERFRDELAQEIPEVDAYYGKFDWNRLIETMPPGFESAEFDPSVSSIHPKHYSYLKISEGCNRTCSYCAIPLITGKHKSVSIEDLVRQVKEKVQNGCHEFQIIGQDTTYYGIDLYGKQSLPLLMQTLAEVEGVKRLRMHYAYPTHFPTDLLPIMDRYPNICPYIDVALQHSSDRMLSLMKRGISQKETEELLSRMRNEVPNLVLRTTMMVGHPGETEEDFQHLLRFVQDQSFERLGAFAYSHERDTFAYNQYEDNIPQEIKIERLNTLMEVQEPIALSFNEARIGSVCEVVVDRHEKEYSIARSVYESPEVDPEILIPRSEKKLMVGRYYQARIVDSMGHDLIATIE